MASCTQIRTKLQAYIDGEMPQSKTVVMEQHVTQCAKCAAVLAKQKEISAFLFEVFAPERLTHDLSASVLAHLPDMDHQRISSHEVTYRVKHARDSRMKGFLTLVPILVPILLVILGVAIVYSWPPDVSSMIAQVGLVTYQDGKTLLSNDVSTRRSRAYLKTPVEAGNRFETGEAASMVFTLAGPSHVKLDANSRIKIENAREINLEMGQAWFDVCKDDHSFRVNTPSGPVMVFGTVFNVAVLEDKTVVTVAEGAVQVENDETFRVVLPGQQVEVALGNKHLMVKPVNAAMVMAWADTIVPDHEAEKLFLATVKQREIHAEQVFVVPSGDHAISSVTFRWRPDSYTGGHCSYHIYVYDDNMKPVFKGYIEAEEFLDKHDGVYELALPVDGSLRKVGIFHISVVPDFTTGTIETSFAEVTALRT